MIIWQKSYVKFYFVGVTFCLSCYVRIYTRDKPTGPSTSNHTSSSVSSWPWPLDTQDNASFTALTKKKRFHVYPNVQVTKDLAMQQWTWINCSCCCLLLLLQIFGFRTNETPRGEDLLFMVGHYLYTIYFGKRCKKKAKAAFAWIGSVKTSQPCRLEQKASVHFCSTDDFHVCASHLWKLLL